MSTVRFAKHDDFDQVFDLGRYFFNESNFNNLTWDEKRAEWLTDTLVGESDVQCMVIEEEGDIVGFSAWTYERYFTVENMAHLFFFYIEPEWRKHGSAKDLMEGMLTMIKAKNIARMYMSSTGGFDDNGVNQRAFTILAKKHGFTEIGAFLQKEF